MKKLLLLAGLLLAGMAQAQSMAGYVNAHNETSFCISPEDVQHRHVVVLRNKEQMIIELTDVSDYILLKNFDSVLRTAFNDVAFYKDSVGELEHVRIDYDIKLGSDNVLMRFTRYGPSANVYVKKNGIVSAMKIDRDTFRIVIRKPLQKRHGPAFLYDYPVQVTFIMNNYNNIGTLLADSGMISQSIDTLTQTMVPERYCPQLKAHQSYAEYHPYSDDRTLYKQTLETQHTYLPGLSKKFIARREAEYHTH